MNLAEAINIQAPYNFERLLYWTVGERPFTKHIFHMYLSKPYDKIFEIICFSPLGCDSKALKPLMDDFEENGKLDIPKVRIGGLLF